jgi:hypothetical protein
MQAECESDLVPQQGILAGGSFIQQHPLSVSVVILRKLLIVLNEGEQWAPPFCQCGYMADCDM